MVRPSSNALAAAPQLVRHFEEAQIAGKAIMYLLQAGRNAVQLSAYREGLTQLEKEKVTPVMVNPPRS